MSHIAIVPSLAPDTHRELNHSNSIIESLCPLKSPVTHSSVSRFHTSRDESYAAEIATLFESTLTLDIDPLCPLRFWHLTYLASHKQRSLSMPPDRTLPSLINHKLIGSLDLLQEGTCCDPFTVTVLLSIELSRLFPSLSLTKVSNFIYKL